MVTVTTKTINYTITKGSKTNCVNATITSTPGANVSAFKKPGGLLKIVELLCAIAAFVLILLSFEKNVNSRDRLLVGEWYPFSISITNLVVLLILIVTYIQSTTSWILVTRTTNLELILNGILAVLNLVAGVLQIVFTVSSKTDKQLLRIIAGVLLLLLALLYIISLIFARKDLKGTRTSSSGK